MRRGEGSGIAGRLRRLALLAATGLLVPAATATAAITPTRTAGDLRAAIDHTGGAVTGVAFTELPPDGTDTNGVFSPAARSDTPLASFPTEGSDYAILSTGYPDGATQPSWWAPGVELDGPAVRGGARDATVLRIDLTVPATGVNCLSVDYRFLTHETGPSAPGSDAFLAELDAPPDWTVDAAGPAISAPRNFAWGPTGGFASSWGGALTTLERGVPPAGVAGTSYPAGTPLDTASVPVTPGPHALYLSVFDLGAPWLDSAALVDNLRLSTSAACGRSRDTEAPAPTVVSPAPGATVGTTPSGSGTAGTALGDHAALRIKTWEGPDATGAPSTVLPIQTTGGTWNAESPFQVSPGQYTSVVEQRDDAGNVGVSAPVTYTVVAPPNVSLSAPTPHISDATPTFEGGAGIEPGDGDTITLRIWSGSDTAAAPLHTIDVARTDGVWSHELATPLADGAYTARADQVNGDTGVVGRSALLAFAVDTVAPAPPVLTEPAEGATVTTRRPTLAGTGALAVGDTVDVDVWTGADTDAPPLTTLTAWADPDAGTWSADVNLLPSGVYSWRATQRDRAGNQASSAVGTFAVAAPPDVAITTPDEGTRTGDLTPLVGGTASTLPGDLPEITVKLHRGTGTDDPVERTLTTNVDADTGEWSVAPGAPLPRGTYTAQAEQSDAGGRVGRSFPVTFRVVGAFVDNGTVQLGINDEGHLNLPGAPPSLGGTDVMGIRYVPTNAEATGPGCECEGWGVADDTAGFAGFANESADGGAVNLTPVSFTATATTAVSVVDVKDANGAAALRVTHDYHPSPATPNLYEVDVTVENLSAAAVDLRYRRVMDWDVEPTAFSEYVTLERGDAADILFTSDNGFASANPLVGPSQVKFSGEAVDNGPADHGALFDFGFGTLGAGQTKTFETFYGAAGTEAQALAALEATGAEAYSLGQPNTDLDEATGKPIAGTPNTFIFAFRGVGGAPVFDEDPPVLTLDAPADGTSTNDATPALSGTAGTAPGDEDAVTVGLWSGAAATGDPLLTLAATRDPITGAYSVAPADGLPDGTYTARASQSDAAGNTGTSAARTFTIDTAAPAVTLETPADGSATGDSTPTFAGAAGDAPGDAATVSVRVEDTAGTAVLTLSASRTGTSWSVTPDDALAPGTYSVTVRQSDAAGNTGTAGPHAFTVGGALPAPTIEEPADGDTLAESRPTFRGLAGDREGDAATVSVALWRGTDTSGPPALVLDATRSGDSWEVQPAAPLANGEYRARATQGGAFGTGASGVVAFTIAAPAELASAGPLTRVRTSDDLGCAVNHVDDQFGEFYGDFACGTLLVVDGTLFGPASLPAGSGAGPRTPFTPVSQTVSGTGTAADPLTIVSVAEAGATGVRVTQRDTYVIGEESYRTSVALHNTGGAERTAMLYRAGDCFLQDSDAGLGEVDPATGAVACKTTPDPVTGRARVQQWFPLSPGSHYYEAGYEEVWARIGAQLAFPDTCRCGEEIDNGAGLSWALTLAAGETATREHLTTFSPAGRRPLTMTKRADAASTPAGGINGYTITVRNPGDAAVTLSAVTDELPSGFAYRPGTTTGATTADPAVAGRVLTWDGPIVVPAGGEVALHFGVTVAGTPGDYLNRADAAAAGPAVVVGTGPTAPVTVTPADAVAPVVTLDEPADGSATRDATPQFAGTAGTAAGDLAAVTVHVWSGAAATGAPVRALDAVRDPATGAFAVSPASGLPDGRYTARAEQSDAAGNVGRSAARTFVVDTTAPAVTLADPGDGPETAPVLAGTAGDAEGDDPTVTVRIFDAGTPVRTLVAPRTGTAYSVTVAPPLPPGVYTARAEQGDALGNGPGVSATQTFTVTRAAPAVALTSPADGARTADATPGFAGTAGDRPGDAGTVTVELFAGGTATGTPIRTLAVARSGGTFAGDVAPALADGTYTARARQTQTLGADGVSAPRTFTVDATAPALTLTAPAATNDDTPRFTGTAGAATGDDANVTVEVFAGTSAAGAPVRELTVARVGAAFAVDVTPALPDGTYTARASQGDDVGNGPGRSSLRTFVVDTVEPAVTLDDPPDGPDTTPAFTGTAGDAPGDAATVRVQILQGAAVVRTLDATRSGAAWTVALPAASALAPGTYSARATQSDAAGNTGQSATQEFTITVAVTVALTSPATGALTTDRTPRLAGTATGAGTVLVDLFRGASAAGAPLRTETAARTGDAFAVDAAPLADGTYTARARLGTATSAARTFTVDATAPGVTLTAPASGATTAPGGAVDLAGAAGAAAGDASTVGLRLHAGAGTGGPVVRSLDVARSGAGWATRVVLAPGTYTAQAVQTDAAGNAGRSAAHTFTVPAAEDVGEIDVPRKVKRSHLFCARERGCRGLRGRAEFRDTGTAVWKLTVTYRLKGRERSATVTTLRQRVTEPGTLPFKLMAIGSHRLLDQLDRATDVRLELKLTFTDGDRNRTVRTKALRLRR